MALVLEELQSKLLTLKRSTTITRDRQGNVSSEQRGEQGEFVTVEVIKTEKKAFFVVDSSADDQLHAVSPGLYISSESGAHNIKQLTEHKISHILSVTPDVKLPHDKDAFEHLILPLLDAEEEELLKHVLEANGWISAALAKGGRVLVHCVAGVSRSASIVLAYLIEHQRMSFDAAYAHLKSRRQQVQPNPGFVKQLREFERRLRQAVREDLRSNASPAQEQTEALLDNAVPNMLVKETSAPVDSDSTPSRTES